MKQDGGARRKSEEVEKWSKSIQLEDEECQGLQKSLRSGRPCVCLAETRAQPSLLTLSFCQVLNF